MLGYGFYFCLILWKSSKVSQQIPKFWVLFGITMVYGNPKFVWLSKPKGVNKWSH